MRGKKDEVTIGIIENLKKLIDNVEQIDGQVALQILELFYLIEEGRYEDNYEVKTLKSYLLLKYNQIFGQSEFLDN